MGISVFMALVPTGSRLAKVSGRFGAELSEAVPGTWAACCWPHPDNCSKAAANPKGSNRSTRSDFLCCCDIYLARHYLDRQRGSQKLLSRGKLACSSRGTGA